MHPNRLKIAAAAKPLALRASEVALAISKATYALAIGEPPGQLVAATPVDRFSPPTMPASIETTHS
jgi:outer membrane protein